MKDPAAYHAWYETPRGAWIGAREAALMLELMQPNRGARLLDVGCGTGWFSAGFAQVGLQVTGLDPDRAALQFAAQRYPSIAWVEGMGERLPFNDGTFDHAAAVTSLCFVDDPAAVLGDFSALGRIPLASPRALAAGQPSARWLHGGRPQAALVYVAVSVNVQPAGCTRCSPGAFAAFGGCVPACFTQCEGS